MVEEYFATVHTCLPIVCKIRLYQHLANPLYEPGADMVLLFLAMKLACSQVPEGKAKIRKASGIWLDACSLLLPLIGQHPS